MEVLQSETFVLLRIDRQLKPKAGVDGKSRSTCSSRRTLGVRHCTGQHCSQQRLLPCT